MQRYHHEKMDLPITEKPTGCRPTSLNCGKYNYFDMPPTQACVLRNSYIWNTTVTETLSENQRCGCWWLAPIWFQDICGYHDVGQSVLISIKYREYISARETLIVVTSQHLKSQAMRQLVQQLLQTNNKETTNPTLLATYEGDKNNNKNSGLPT